MKNQIMIGLLLVTAGLVGSCDANHKEDGNTDTSMVSETTAKATLTDTMKLGGTKENGIEGTVFLENAATGSMVEVEMAKSGALKGTTKEIKEVSATLQKDHLSVLSELKVLAKNKGLKLPETLRAEQQEHLKNLNDMTGKNFDRYYVNMLVEDHITDISLYEGATKSPDTTISNFARKILPKLQQHYEMARKLSAGFDPNDPKNK